MSLVQPSHSDLAGVKLLKPIIDVSSGNFCSQFNHSSFAFSHNLAEHPLFQIHRLAELANFMLREGSSDKVTCLVGGEVPIGIKWSERAPKEQVEEAITRIEESGSWILIRDVQYEPEYKALVDQIMIELEELTGVALRKEITWAGALIFISSPNSVTNYHIDHESNFLFQIHGSKEANLFDQNDHSVLTERELESFYIGNIEAANYREEIQSKASVYHLTPGKGIHIPVNAPHWVRTGNQFSVTLSVLFYMRPFDLQARIYQANYYLRKLGLKPTSPGKSALLDRMKINLIGAFSKRKPETKYEVFRSGIDRIAAPLLLGRRIVRRLKRLPKDLLKKLPLVSDYYRYYWCFHHEISSCRGVYKTFSEAILALPPGSRISHNQLDIHDHPAVSELTSRRTIGRLDSFDYPLLPWLKSAVSDSSTVFDFGGNVGVSYYAFQKHLPYPENLRWLVCELPEIVKAGRKIAGETDSKALSFTTEFSDADGVDILLTCGTLPYVEPSLTELLKPLRAKPKHLLINYVPFVEGESFITLQNIGYAFSPYKVQNRTDFLASLTSLGYELIDSWEDNRTCSIPFHPECFVRAFHGFYLRLNGKTWV